MNTETRISKTQPQKISWYSSLLSRHSSSGFTLIELLVSIAIFTIMTALVVAKYGSFNQSVLLTNTAYDIALTIRTAQTYGVSVRSSDDGVANFNYGYGVHFAPNESAFTFFVDRDGNGVYGVGDGTPLNVYTLKRGAKIGFVCFEASCNSGSTQSEMNITFLRPNPNANICNDDCSSTNPLPSYSKIVIQGTDGSVRQIVVRGNGQIAVEN